MGYFVMNVEKTKTVEGLLEDALSNLDLFLEDIEDDRYKDDMGQTPLEYLLKGFSREMILKALQIIKEDGQIKKLENNSIYDSD